MSTYARCHWALLGSTAALAVVALASRRMGWFVVDALLVTALVATARWLDV